MVSAAFWICLSLVTSNSSSSIIAVTPASHSLTYGVYTGCNGADAEEVSVARPAYSKYISDSEADTYSYYYMFFVLGIDEVGTTVCPGNKDLSAWHLLIHQVHR
jgi:hypothetical protein